MDQGHKKKIGFLFIDKTYNIYHSLSIAIALAEYQIYEVHILCTPKNRPLIEHYLAHFDCKSVQLKILRPHWHINIPHYLEIKFQLRPSIFFKYARYLQGFDALVCTIYDDLSLKKRFGPGAVPKFVFTNHGIPNRAYSFDAKVLDFDLYFILGDREKEMRKELKHLRPGNHATTGFLKYDLVKHLVPRYYFPNDKPLVLYNPHWDRKFSSYYIFGQQILEFFAKQSRYNLIFAPHALISERNWSLRFKMMEYEQCDNIRIDLGSESSNNMAYTKAADVYLGDISSQAFEFLVAGARPCLFLDAHQLAEDRENRPLSWDLGPIIEEVKDLEQQLDQAIANHEKYYKQLQISTLQKTILSAKQSPSQIAAAAIDRLLL